MSFKVVNRKIYTIKKSGKQLTYTELSEGPIKEYHYPDNQTSVFTRDPAFVNYLQRQYIVFPEGDHFLLVTPYNSGIHAGWLDPRSTSEFNIYKVDRFALWAHLVPESFLEEFQFEEPPLKGVHVEGKYLTGPKWELEKAWRKYRKLLVRREPNKGLLIQEGRILNLYEKLLLDGVMPWTPKNVQTADKWKTDIDLRPYQTEALDLWLQHGAATLVWPFGAGKTFFLIRLITAVSGPTLIITPSTAVLKTAEEYLRAHLKGPTIGVWYGEKKQWGDVVVTTYPSVVKNQERFKGPWKLLCYEEAHQLPAETWMRTGFIAAEYRIAPTGSPWREDGRTECIYMLGGFPIGHDWERLIREGWVKKPSIFLHLTDFKLITCKQLVEKLPPKTLIFCDSIELGKEAESFLGLKFVYGKHTTTTRFKILREHKKLITSRIFDKGIDVPDLKSAIELDFMGSSRAQEAQRAGRLMHCLSDGATYHILMTEQEYDKYNRRLHALYARGFDIKVVK